MHKKDICLFNYNLLCYHMDIESRLDDRWVLILIAVHDDIDTPFQKEVTDSY